MKPRIENLLSIKRLRLICSYDPASGDFVRITAAGSNGSVGRKMGWSHPRGYWMITIDQRKYLAHRLAWFYVTGAWPAEQIDHINGNRLDNRFINLREATPLENLRNMCGRRGRCGYKGVTDNKSGKFDARIRYGGKKLYLGSFDTAEEAHEAYVDAAKRFFGEYARAA